jgi:hypothetical protein
MPAIGAKNPSAPTPIAVAAAVPATIMIAAAMPAAPVPATAMPAAMMPSVMPATVMTATVKTATSGCFGRDEHHGAECRGGTKDRELMHGRILLHSGVIARQFTNDGNADKAHFSWRQFC